jgi:beta-glucanase (GH16 family)
MRPKNLKRSFFLAALGLALGGANAHATTEIKAVHSGQCLDIDYNSPADGIRLQQWTCSGGAAQRFTPKLLANGFYEVRTNSGPNQCLDVSGSAVPSELRQMTCNGGDAQQFSLRPRNGAYEMRPKLNASACMDVDYASMNNGAKISTWTCHDADNQLFRMELPPTVIPVNKITVASSGFCLDVPSAANEAQLQQVRCGNYDSQKFELRALSDGFYEMRTKMGANLCVDIEGASRENASNVQQYACNGTISQQFSLRPRDGGYEIRPRVNLNSCFDVEYASMSEYAKIQEYGCHGGTNQLFEIDAPLSPPTPPAPPSEPASPYVPADYVKVFGDEFNGSSLDTSRWWSRFVYNGGTLDYVNDEIQRYRENGNHRVSGGTLKMIAKPQPDGSFTSGMIRSKTTIKYGYFEMRAKMPGGLGTWTAFWLNPEDQRWPAEIDILEYVNNGVEDRVDMFSTRGQDHGPQGYQQLLQDSSFDTTWKFWRAPFSFAEDFHVIGALWDTDDTVTVTVDGRLISKYRYLWVHNDGSDAGMAHILLNLAMGGNWAGRHGVDRTREHVYELDYVRAYQRKGATRTGTSTVGQDFCQPGAC